MQRHLLSVAVSSCDLDADQGVPDCASRIGYSQNRHMSCRGASWMMWWGWWGWGGAFG